MPDAAPGLHQLPPDLLHELARCRDTAAVRAALPPRVRHLAGDAAHRLTGGAHGTDAAGRGDAPSARTAAPATDGTGPAPAAVAEADLPDLTPPTVAGARGPFMDPRTLIAAGNANFPVDKRDPANRRDPDGIHVRYVPAAESGTGGPVVRISWVRPDWVGAGEHAVYRVVSADAEFPLSPEDGERVTCLQGMPGRAEIRFEEPAPEGVAFRHYQVWANVGRTAEEIYLDAQPRLVGEDICPFPLPGVQIVESQGVVEGRWGHVDGYDRIRVEVSRPGARGMAEEIPVPAGQRSFTYRAPVRGVPLTFRVAGVVGFRGADRLDDRGVTEHVDISADLIDVELEEVRRITTDDGADQIEATWFAPPAGLVRIYLSAKAPDADLSFAPIDVSALRNALPTRDGAAAGPGDGPADDRRFAIIACEKHGDDGMPVSHVAMWPNDWDEVHVTPAAIVGDRVKVGETKLVHRVRPIRNAELSERVSGQVVTFEWPQGAAAVKVGVTSLGDGEAPVTAKGEISREDYERAGGLRLQLNHTGERVVLTPCAYNAGAEIAAEPTVLDYPGVAVYGWNTTEDSEGAGLWLRIWRRDSEDYNPPRFVLVHHPRRMPLSPADADDEGAGILPVQTVQEVTVTGIGPGSEVIAPAELAHGPSFDNTDYGWFIPVPGDGLDGQWVRLFIIEDPAAAVVADAPRRVVVDTFQNRGDLRVQTPHVQENPTPAQSSLGAAPGPDDTGAIATLRFSTAPEYEPAVRKERKTRKRGWFRR